VRPFQRAYPVDEVACLLPAKLDANIGPFTAFPYASREAYQLIAFNLVQVDGYSPKQWVILGVVFEGAVHGTDDVGHVPLGLATGNAGAVGMRRAGPHFIPSRRLGEP
jgi:hypothetical protein